MPQANPNVPTLSRKFAGIAITVPGVFAEGQPLTASEAKWANAVLATVAGNAFGNAKRKADAQAAETAKAEWVAAGNKAKDFDPSTVTSAFGQSDFDAMFASMTLGEGRRSTGPKAAADPIERTIHFLNSEDLKKRIQAKGLKVRDFQKSTAQDPATYGSRFAELLAANLAAKGDEFRAQAEAMVAASSTEAGPDPLLDAA